MLLDCIKNVITNVTKELDFDIDEMKVVKSNRPDLCDYQCDDVFKLSKIYHKNPMEIGETIVSKLNELPNFNEYFKKVEFVKPGFINIIVSDTLLNNNIKLMITNPKFNFKKLDKVETYVIDYGGPNVAKPLHVGHLRPAIIGESLKRIINYKGHKTIGDVHLGDYGLQIGQVIYGILEDKKNINDIDLAYLEETYPKMSARCKENEEVNKECARITKELQDGKEEYQLLWKKIREISVADIKRLYDKLGVSFELWNGESDEYQYIDSVTEYLESKGLIENSEGAKIINVKKEEDTKEIPPLIYQKNNGAYLYSTTDLATIYERVKFYNPEYIIYVVDGRQSLHFEQVFRVCEKSGLSNNANLEHIGFGTMNGTDGKPFKTRNGDMLRLEDLIKNTKQAFINLKEDNELIENDNLDKITNAIIMFADLQNNPLKDYVFDINKFSSVNGKTGPYILYTYLRIKKIIEKESLNINKFSNNIYNIYDRDLRIKLIELESTFNNAFISRMPNYIADYLYDLCVLTNVFYQNNRINDLDDEIKKNDWQILLKLVSDVLESMLSLLIIEIPTAM